jgi:hypothetical protein
MNFVVAVGNSGDRTRKAIERFIRKAESSTPYGMKRNARVEKY